MSDGTDFAGLTEGLAIRFWGKPTSSTKSAHRWGSGGSRSFNIADMVWFDHELGKGGGAIDLVMREIGTDSRADALAWMEKEGLIDARHVASAAPQRQEAPAPSNEPPEQERLPVDVPQPKEVAIEGYRYTDGDGAHLYDVIRFHYQFPDGTWQMGKNGTPKKTFKQRRPDGRGGFLWGLGDVQTTIFRRQEIEIAVAEGRTIGLTEGEKDVKTLEAWEWAATTNSGGAQGWKPEFAEFLRGADVVIFGDDDDAGRARVEAVALTLRGIAGRIRAITTWGGHKDVTDWRDAGGTAEQLAEIANCLPDWKPRPPSSKFNAVSVRDAGNAATLHEWLVQDLIELHGTAAFSGYSQSGKSFQMIELAFAVAMGRKFWGRDTKQGVVIYQVGEGEEGFMKRVEGYLKDRGIDDPASVPIVILPKKINLFQSDDDATNLIAEAKAWSAYWGMPLRMIVIDTYNKATRGANEISGQDIGKINERLERIQLECHCNVTVVDHLSKGGTVRGHGSKTDDVNNMIRVEKDDKKVDRNGRPIRRMRLDKNKDGENGGVIEFVLRQVVVGFSDDGKAITTCVVEAPHGSEEELERSGRLPLNQSLILQTIRDVIARDGNEAPNEVKDVPKGKHVVSWKAIMTELRRKWIYKAPESEPEQRERELQRIVADAGKRLQVNGYIDRDNTSGIVWWTGKTDRPLFKTRPLPDRPQEQPGAGISEEERRELASGEPPF